MTVCAECGKAIENRAIEIGGRILHPDCFKCSYVNSKCPDVKML